MLAIPQHTSTDRLSCPLYQKLYVATGSLHTIGALSAAAFVLYEDYKHCIRYNAYRLLRQLLYAEARRSIMSTAVLEGGYVREDIRLGNEALTRQDLDTARQYFQQVLVSDDATVMQKRIATNRLREIDELRNRLADRSRPGERARRGASSAARRARTLPPSERETRLAHAARASDREC